MHVAPHTEAGIAATAPYAAASVAQNDPSARAPKPRAEASNVPEQAREMATRFGNSEAHYRVSDDGDIRVTVVNRDTGEIVREIPPENLTAAQRANTLPGANVDVAA